MTKKEKVKNYYFSFLWSDKKLADAVSKGWITAEECDEIKNERKQTYGRSGIEN